MYMPAQDLTIAESNRLSSKFDEYIITFNKKNVLICIGSLIATFNI